MSTLPSKPPCASPESLGLHNVALKVNPFQVHKRYFSCFYGQLGWSWNTRLKEHRVRMTECDGTVYLDSCRGVTYGVILEFAWKVMGKQEETWPCPHCTGWNTNQAPLLYNSDAFSGSPAHHLSPVMILLSPSSQKAPLTGSTGCYPLFRPCIQDLMSKSDMGSGLPLGL